MANRSHGVGLILWLASAAAVARADTVQHFDAPAGGTAYAQTDPARVAPPEFTDFGPDCANAGAQRLVEGSRTFLRLAHYTTPGPDHRNCNAVTFNCVEPPTAGEVAIDFDFRVTKPNGPSDAADGFSLSLVRAGDDLAPGGPPIEIDELAGPGLPEVPNLPGSLGFGFRVYRDPQPTNGELLESVKIYWAGALVQKLELPADQTMVNTGWIHAAIRVDFGRQQVSLLLTREDTTELLRMPLLVIPGLAPYATRVHLAAAARGLTANFDIDELAVGFPPRDLAMVGSWSPAFPLASVPIHAALLPGGKVLYWDRHDLGDGRPFLWDGLTSTVTPDMPTKPGTDHMYDVFCAGHTFAADGSLFVAGGHIADQFGQPWTSQFDPVAETWSSLAPMQAGRWYPTTTTLPDGNVVAVSGTIDPFAVNEIPEVYDARANRWRALTGARRSLELYPFMFTTPKGLFAAGSMIDTGFLDVGAPGQWIPVDQTIAGRNPPATAGRNYGSAVLTDAARGRILLIGGTTQTPGVTDQTLRSSEWIDLSQPEPRWQPGPSMTFARRMHVATLLPDGSVLVTGGTTSNDFNRADGAVLNAELLTNLEDQWQPMACGSEARVYHSVALLLPDARVLVAGGGHPGELEHPTAEIFSPPYLHRGGSQLAAPVILAGPGVELGPGGIARVRYGATIAYSTADPSRVAAVTWLRPAAVTHAFNQDQRIVELAAAAGGIGAQVLAPTDPAVAPPGPYMMFLVDNHGVPSHAAWVRTNLPPDAVDDLIETVEDQAIAGVFDRIVANDVDVEHDPTTVTIVDPPARGQIIDGAYLPFIGVSGDDSFTYTLSDGLDTSRLATVAIRIAAIDDPPDDDPPAQDPPDDNQHYPEPPGDAGCTVGSQRSMPAGSFALLIAVASILARRRRCARRKDVGPVLLASLLLFGGCAKSKDLPPPVSPTPPPARATDSPMPAPEPVADPAVAESLGRPDISPEEKPKLLETDLRPNDHGALAPADAGPDSSAMKPEPMACAPPPDRLAAMTSARRPPTISRRTPRASRVAARSVRRSRPAWARSIACCMPTRRRSPWRTSSASRPERSHG